MSSDMRYDEKILALPVIETPDGLSERSTVSNDLALKALEKRVLRKTDMVILPMMCFVFFFQYLDKQSLSYASVYGLITDLDLHGTQYSWTSSMFYVGQLVSEFPSMYLMSRLPLTKFVGCTIIVWGAICMCLAAPTTYGGFLAVRFCLGMAEGAVSPAFITITSMWYKKNEHPLRIGCWISCNALAQVIGSLLMYGIGQHNTSSIAAWRLMFIICGVLTSVTGVVFVFIMPSRPETAWFLTPDERLAAGRRLASQHDGGDKTNFSLAQLKEAVFDFSSYAAFAFGVLVTAPSIVLTFASLIIKELGYTSGATLLYGSPSGAVQLVAIWIGIIACQFWPNRRCLITICLIAIPLAGCIMLLVLPERGWPVIVGAWLGCCISSIFSLTMTLNASNVRGNTKKSVINTLYFIGYCAGCIGFPQLWTSDAAPRYLAGVIVSIAAWSVLVFLLLFYWFHASHQNRKRDRLQRESQVALYEPGEDVTDKQDMTFRYST
ncbi:putative transporter [Lachnellula occidentalis]|uniref:Putative transporter n=1 Tax=Lachnellula occidentalis TaxID=215460 RepID=A0A8H8UGD9_9HELO|nr:putative transporter [Lachnellula occidentalis]